MFECLQEIISICVYLQTRLFVKVIPDSIGYFLSISLEITRIFYSIDVKGKIFRSLEFSFVLKLEVGLIHNSIL